MKGRVAQIKRAIDDTDSDWDREKLQERLAKLAGGVAVVKVGAATEVELKEKKHRIEDALSATRAAVEEGIVAGGGTALIRARKSVNELADSLEGDEATGARIVSRRSRRRSGGSPSTPAWRAPSSSARSSPPRDNGLNAATGEIEDLVKAGIIDPAKVTRSPCRTRPPSPACCSPPRPSWPTSPRRSTPPGPRNGGRHGRHGWHGRDDVTPSSGMAGRRFARPHAGIFGTPRSTVQDVSGVVAGSSDPASARLGARFRGDPLERTDYTGSVDVGLVRPRRG